MPNEHKLDERTQFIQKIARKLPGSNYNINTYQGIAIHFVGKRCIFEGKNNKGNAAVIIGSICGIFANNNSIIITLSNSINHGQLLNISADLDNHENIWGYAYGFTGTLTLAE